MQVSHLHVRRPRIPERCRRAPDCAYDGTFGFYLCNVRDSPCFYRGPAFVLDANGGKLECRKTESDSAS